ncbi:hypothetical protein [Nocardioides fonticola]
MSADVLTTAAGLLGYWLGGFGIGGLLGCAANLFDAQRRHR